MQEASDSGNVGLWTAAIGGVVLGIAADRLTKIYFFDLPRDAAIGLIPGVLDLTHHQNPGIVGDIPIPRGVILALSLLVLGAVLVGIKRAIVRKHGPAALSLSLILAGAIGNLWDRLQWGFVFDWLLLFNRSVINLADIAIALGIIWYLMAGQLDNRRFAD